MDSKCLSRVKREKLCSMVIEAIKISECGSVKPFCFIDAARAADLFHKRGVISMYGSPCMIPRISFSLVLSECLAVVQIIQCRRSIRNFSGAKRQDAPLQMIGV